MYKKERKIFDTLPYVITKSNFQLNDAKFVHVGPKKYNIPEKYQQYGLDIYNFEARPDDVYLMGYPRSGTTMHSEMLWLIGNDLDYEEAAKNFIDYRFPHIEAPITRVVKLVETKIGDETQPTEYLKEVAEKYRELTPLGLAGRKGRRFIKSHLPISLMPPHAFEVGAKMIYCARNPKDLIVSSYKVLTLFNYSKAGEGLTLKKYFEIMKNDNSLYSPHFEHLKEAWAKRNDENFLLIFYEDSIKSLRETILRVANFLNKNLTNDQLEGLENHLSFNVFKNNPTVNCDHLVRIGVASKGENFIRNGKSGTWTDYMTSELEAEIDEWVAKNLEGTDIKYPTV